MKRTIILLITLFALTLFSCKENAASKISDDVNNKVKNEIKNAKDNLPVLTFASTDFDFGTIDQGDVVTAIFEYENTGGSDLVITKAKASCGCTVPDWPKGKAIKPGEKGQITAEFDSKTKKNKQNKTVTLTTNTADVKIVLHVKGFVTPDPNLVKNKKGLKTANK